MVRNDQLFILEAYGAIVIYNFTDASNCKLVTTLTKWKQNSISPVDFKFVRGELWVLDSEFGFYTYSLT